MKIYLKICIFLLLLIATIELTIDIKENHQLYWSSLYIQAAALSFFFFSFLKFRKNIPLFIFSCILMFSFEINDLLMAANNLSQQIIDNPKKNVAKSIYLITPLIIASFYIILSLSRIRPGFVTKTKTIIILSASFLLIRLTINGIALKSNLENPEFYWNNINYYSYIFNSVLWASIDIIFIGFLFFYLSKLKKHE